MLGYTPYDGPNIAPPTLVKRVAKSLKLLQRLSRTSMTQPRLGIYLRVNRPHLPTT
jgi:hypothetical protein